MKTNSKIALLSTAILAFIGGGAAIAKGSNTYPWISTHDGISDKVEMTSTDDVMPMNSSVSVSQAIAIAEQYAGGKANQAQFTSKRGQSFFEVEVISGTKIMDVQVDAHSGTVIGSKEDKPDSDKDEIEANALNTPVSLLQAIDTAEQQVGGKVRKVELEHERSTLVYDMEVINGIKVMDVTVDAHSGAVLRAKAGDADRDNDENDDETDNGDDAQPHNEKG